ncbi:APN2 [Sanghuangporus sanghuang]
MRLLTWNINGIRTLPLYHPWNSLRTGENILNELGADIICFQEVKTTRQSIDKSIALPNSYDSFFSLPTVKGGYSGVCIYTKSSVAVPLKAEEGLSGRLQCGLKPPLPPEERISQTLPLAHEMELVDDEATNSHNDLLELDKEGRAIMIDFGPFVLINVYCPNETSDSRLPYKMNFHLLLQERVRLLVEVDKREVIVVGDINVCAAPIDHCDGELPSNKEEFWVHPARKWFHEWLHPIGPMVDVVRNCWPDRKGMFTCWNQKIEARRTNYGTRIDYFLLTKGLLPWFKRGDIQPQVKGSDHCPVYIDLHDQIIDGDGRTLYLRNMMKMDGEKRDPPRLATKYWPELSGKQKLLSSFFGKKDTAVAKPVEMRTTDVSLTIARDTSVSAIASHTPSQADMSQPPEAPNGDSDRAITSPIACEKTQSPTSSFPSNLTATSSPKTTTLSGGDPANVGTPPQQLEPPLKRKKMQADSNYPAQASKKTKKKNGPTSGKKPKDPTAAQTKLSSFFAGPSSSQSLPDIDEVEQNASTHSQSQSQQKSEIIDVDALLHDSDDVSLRPSPSPILQSSPSLSIQGSSQSDIDKDKDKGKKSNSHSWSTLFARVDPPKCTVHGEPAREFRVNKPGPNKGKAFFICARPVGPGYDAGRDRRLREEVDSQYRCNFFKWSSEVKRDALRGAESKRNGT